MSADVGRALIRLDRAHMRAKSAGKGDVAARAEKALRVLEMFQDYD